MRRILAFGVVLSVLACGERLGIRADEVKQGPMAGKAPFDTIKTQHMVVQVKINGKGPYRLIFDTGAPVMLITNKVAKEAGVFPKDFKRPVFALFGSVGQFKIQEMEIGDVKAANIATMVMDHPTVSALASAVGPIEGIVGLSFWGKYKMTIDYQAKEMTFLPTSYEPKDMMQVMMKSMMGPKSTKKIVAPQGQFGFRAGKEAKDAEPGVTVQEVYASSSAAGAGLKVGDRLLALDGRWTDSAADCAAAASHIAPGREARLIIRREGKEIELKIKVQAGL